MKLTILILSRIYSTELFVAYFRQLWVLFNKTYFPQEITLCFSRTISIKKICRTRTEGKYSCRSWLLQDVQRTDTRIRNVFRLLQRYQWRRCLRWRSRMLQVWYRRSRWMRRDGWRWQGCNEWCSRSRCRPQRTQSCLEHVVCISLNTFDQVSTSLNKFKQLWTRLDKIEQVWASLDKFEQV